MSYPKPDIKELLAKGLSGFEAGRLILQESIERGRGEQVLNDNELAAIRDSIKTLNDQVVFNNLMDVLRVMELLSLKANIRYLEITGDLKTTFWYIHMAIAPCEKFVDVDYKEVRDKFHIIEKLRNNPEIVKNIDESIKLDIREISQFKGFMAVMQDTARVLNLPNYLQDITYWEQRLVSNTEIYNNYRDLLKNFIELVDIQLSIPTKIIVSKIKPHPEVVKSWRTKIARGTTVGGLGKNWWKRTESTPKVKEDISIND